MSDNQQDIDLFEAYLQGSLGEEDQQEFENRLNEDKEFRSSYLDYQLAIDIIKKEGLRQEVEILFQGKNSKTFPIRTVWIGSAASLVLIVFFFTLFNTEETNIYATYYQPYPNIVATRSDNIKSNVAMNAYSKGEFEKSIISLKLEGKDSDTSRFYLGMSYMATDQLDSARFLLAQIDESSIFNQQKIWYMALIAIDKKDYGSAIALLKEIDEGEFKHSEAVDILAAIDQDQ